MLVTHLFLGGLIASTALTYSGSGFTSIPVQHKILYFFEIGIYLDLIMSPLRTKGDILF